MVSASHSRTARELKTAIITGRESEHLRYRAKELHITEVYQGNLDKRAAYADLKAKLGLADEEIAYFGDDLVDLPIMGQVGFPRPSPTPCRKWSGRPSCSRTIRAGTVPCASSSSSSSRRRASGKT